MKILFALAILSLTTSVSLAADRVKVLIIDGVNNHDWESTTAATKATLERTGRFTVDVSTSPSRGASKQAWKAWRPKFSDYHVVLSNFNDDCEEEDGCEPLWSSETRVDFEKFVREGGGFVSVHAADNAFANWVAYNEIIGVGGWGGRQAGKSGSLLRKIDGRWQPSSPNEGLSGEHGDMREFLVIHDQPAHPILNGLPREWMHAEDELYSALRGPARNIEVLAHSYSLLTEENEPMLMLITYGKGKIFHLPMGHYSDKYEPYGASLHCVGFQTVLARGTEYVATGEVTVDIPSAFPGKEKAVVVAPDKLEWHGKGVLSGNAPNSKERNQNMENTDSLKIKPLGGDIRASLRSVFSKRVVVFGLGVYASPSTPDTKVLHAANVLAEYVDNDQDGNPDNPLVVESMKRHKAGMMMFATEREADRLHPNTGDLNLQGLWGEETRPGGAARGEFDATLEEVLHVVTQFGYAEAYPEVFGERPGTAVAKAMDRARGGHFQRVPHHYPPDAWYTYDDRTCDYSCQITEYIYWGLTSLLGAQDFADRGEQIGNEWRLNTPAKLKTGDPHLYRLLTDPKYRFPTKLPQGSYRPKSSESKF